MVVEARDQVGQRGLATTGTSHQGDHLARLGAEGDVVQNRLLTARVLETQVAHFETATDAFTLDLAVVRLGLLVQLLEDALGTRQAFLDGRTDLGQLADGFRQ
ncbi:hypothetical protein D9M68_667110 [compost metagenome]